MIFAGYALACIAVGPLSVPGVFINNLFFLFGGAAFGARQN
jgi:hypothetical protein